MQSTNTITTTTTTTQQVWLAPQVEPQVKKKVKKQVQWTEDSVDNENMGKLKSKACCIYHKPHQEQSSSDDTCTSDDEINAIERDKTSKQKHKAKCSKPQKDCCKH